MNDIILYGRIRDIEYSHDICGIEYNKAKLICERPGKEDDVISLKFKKFSNRYKEGDLVELKGNIRSYSQRLGDKNKVDIYVFTYFDIPDATLVNSVKLDGRICKLDRLRYSKTGKEYIHFILANNIYVGRDKKINNYIPCVCYGESALMVNELKINDVVNLNGQLHSHTYRKEENNEIIFKVAHEVNVSDIELIKE